MNIEYWEWEDTRNSLFVCGTLCCHHGNWPNPMPKLPLKMILTGILYYYLSPQWNHLQLCPFFRRPAYHVGPVKSDFGGRIAKIKRAKSPLQRVIQNPKCNVTRNFGTYHPLRGLGYVRENEYPPREWPLVPQEGQRGSRMLTILFLRTICLKDANILNSPAHLSHTHTLDIYTPFHYLSNSRCEARKWLTFTQQKCPCGTYIFYNPTAPGVERSAHEKRDQFTAWGP